MLGSLLGKDPYLSNVLPFFDVVSFLLSFSFSLVLMLVEVALEIFKAG